MKIIIFVFCLIFITIGYTRSAAAVAQADDQIPVEVIVDSTDSPTVLENDNEQITEIKVDESPIEKPVEKPIEKPVELPKRKIPVNRGRTEKKTTEKPVERRIEKLEPKTNSFVEKLEPKSNPVIDRGSNRFTENVIHSISNGPDDYSFSFKTEEGHNRDESVHIDRTGKSLNDNEDDLGNISAKGSYSFISADGFEYTVDYYADGKGYHPKVNVRKL